MEKQLPYYLRYLNESSINAKSSSNEEQREYISKYSNQLISVHREVQKRNVKLSELLSNFIAQTRQRKKMNGWLRIITFVNIFAILDVFTYFLFVKIRSFSFEAPTTEAAVSILALVIGYVGSFIGALEIITKYLFPAKEESDAAELLKVVVNNDQQIEEIMSKMAIDNFNK